MLLKRRRPHHDSKSKGLKSLKTGLGGSTQYIEEDDAIWPEQPLADLVLREVAKVIRNV